MKKIILGFLSILLCFSLTSCTKAKPEDAVKGYFEALKTFDTDKMKTFVSEKDTTDEATKSSKANDEYSKAFLDYFKANAAKVSYTIKSSEVKDDKAVVTVDCKYIDGTTLFKETFQEFILKVFSNALSDKKPTDEENSKELVSIMTEKQKALKEVTAEKTIKINCVKVDKKWYIEKVDDDLQNVLSSNYFAVAKDMQTAFDKSNK